MPKIYKNMMLIFSKFFTVMTCVSTTRVGLIRKNANENVGDVCYHNGLYNVNVTPRNISSLGSIIRNQCADSAYVSSWNGQRSDLVLRPNGTLTPYNDLTNNTCYAICADRQEIDPCSYEAHTWNIPSQRRIQCDNNLWKETRVAPPHLNNQNPITVAVVCPPLPKPQRNETSYVPSRPICPPPRPLPVRHPSTSSSPSLTSLSSTSNWPTSPSLTSRSLSSLLPSTRDTSTDVTRILHPKHHRSEHHGPKHHVPKHHVPKHHEQKHHHGQHHTDDKCHPHSPIEVPIRIPITVTCQENSKSSSSSSSTDSSESSFDRHSSRRKHESSHSESDSSSSIVYNTSCDGPHRHHHGAEKNHHRSSGTSSSSSSRSSSDSSDTRSPCRRRQTERLICKPVRRRDSSSNLRLSPNEYDRDNEIFSRVVHFLRSRCKQKHDRRRFTCKEVRYALQRLFEGLCGNRRIARRAASRVCGRRKEDYRLIDIFRAILEGRKILDSSSTSYSAYRPSPIGTKCR